MSMREDRSLYLDQLWYLVTFENTVLAVVEVETRLQGIKFLLGRVESKAGDELGLSRILSLKCGS